MSTPRFTPEFKEEAVRQITEQTHEQQMELLELLVESDSSPLTAGLLKSHLLRRWSFIVN